jgi:hypothetical protein
MFSQNWGRSRSTNPLRKNGWLPIRSQPLRIRDEPEGYLADTTVVGPEAGTEVVLECLLAQAPRHRARIPREITWISFMVSVCWWI